MSYICIFAQATRASDEADNRKPTRHIGVCFAADVLKRCKQTILVLRKTTTSYTVASIVSDEKSATLRENVARLCLTLRPLNGPIATV
jgi:hypothetical protein